MILLEKSFVQQATRKKQKFSKNFSKQGLVNMVKVMNL
jgi:hypothetical protein